MLADALAIDPRRQAWTLFMLTHALLASASKAPPARRIALNEACGRVSPPTRGATDAWFTGTSSLPAVGLILGIFVSWPGLSLRHTTYMWLARTAQVASDMTVISRRALVTSQLPCPLLA